MNPALKGDKTQVRHRNEDWLDGFSRKGLTSRCLEGS